MKRRKLVGAYARGLYYACGIDDAEDKPLVGIANSANDLVPGHVYLGQVAEVVKEGARAAGGVGLALGAAALGGAAWYARRRR